MACEASGKPQPDVAWIRNGILESSGKKAAFLKFDNINRTDAGQYTCRANNSVEVTSIGTTIVVHCKYILTLIFYFWINFVYSAPSVIWVSKTILTNLFKSVRKQNSISNPFRLCMDRSQVPKIYCVWLAYRASAYSDSVWGFWLRLNGKLRIGQNSNCQLRNYMFFLLIAEISW